MKKHHSKHAGKKAVIAIITAVAVMGVFAAIDFVTVRRDTSARHITTTKPSLLSFAPGFTPEEQAQVTTALAKTKLSDPVTASVQTVQVPGDSQPLNAYVVVTNPYSNFDNAEHFVATQAKVYVNTSYDNSLAKALAQSMGASNPVRTKDIQEQLLQDPNAIAIIPAEQLSANYKLLKVGGNYYLDSFTTGAIFRSVRYSGVGAGVANKVPLTKLYSKGNVLKLNMSGVTAITRDLMLKIQQTGDGAYPAKNIGSFLADADLTHTSDEVSFLSGCHYSLTAFCAPPSSIDALKAIGADIIELTGNHNNDVGSAANTATINEYHTLGWSTFGGGLNASEATQPFIANQKGSRVALLGYNYYDTVHRSAAIAGAATAGANSFDFDKIKQDIVAAKKRAQFVIVDVQYQECYAYPNGYILAPACYKPITSPNQTADFRRIVDLGADIVIGTQAHQPQTYELYHGKSIYYGLGNLFFDQFEWPGTEQGMVLTHYFQAGRLIQTKLSPTVYDKSMQTRLMTSAEAEPFLANLTQARP